MRKIFGGCRLPKRSRRKDAGTPSSVEKAPKPVIPKERNGLFELTKGISSPDPDDGQEKYPVDIIAIHGLNGHPFDTWTHENGIMWLRDFLPGDLPGCRVYTYGYPSQVVSRSTMDVKGYARLLLGRIQHDVLSDDRTDTRRIIFVCHSLGGIVCKQVLVIAHEDNTVTGNVKLQESLAGIVFLGTPHRGSNKGDLGHLVGMVVNAVTGTTSAGLYRNAVNSNLVATLGTNAKQLQDLTESVRNRLEGLKIVSFYETRPEFPFGLIVEKYSATMGIPREEIYPLDSGHRAMCRVDSRNNAYKHVVDAIKDVARSPVRNSSEKSWNESCMALFSKRVVSDYQTRRPANGTCQWIMQHPSFVSWREKAENPLLWLTGPPGCGKTIMSSFLAKHLEPTESSSTSNVYIYFCDDTITLQTDAKNILINLIFQLVHKHRGLARHVSKFYESHQENIVQNFTALWDLFEAILLDPTYPKAEPTIIIIDALDECEEITRRPLLESIQDFLQPPKLARAATSDLKFHAATSGRRHVKFILTCRPNLTEVQRMIDTAPNSRIPIDEARTDLDIYIQERLDEISKRREIPSDIQKSLQTELCSEAENTFLWVSIVLSVLESSKMMSVNDLKSFVERIGIPGDLERIYTELVSEIDPDDLDEAAKLLKLILGSSRQLSLEEINIAFSIDHRSHRTVDNVRAHSQAGMQRTLQNILGQLVRVSNGIVSLVHLSFKEFILDSPSSARTKLPHEIGTIEQEDCALAIATACIHYILLDDFSENLFGRVNSSDSASDSSGDDNPLDHMPGDVESPDDPAPNPGNDSQEDDKYKNVAVGDDGLFRDTGAIEQDTCEDIAKNHTFYRYAALHWAEHYAQCEASAPAELRDAVISLIDLNSANCTNWLRFHSAEAVLTVDASIPATFSDHITLAAFFNLHGVLEHLLLTSQKNIFQDHLDSALYRGAERGHDKVVSILLRVGANPNACGAQISGGQQTAFIAAAKNGHVACVKTLLADQRTDINIKGELGRNALSYACQRGHKEVVQALLGNKDCKLNDEDDSGSTPLIWAARSGNPEIVKWLLERASVADVNHRDKKGRTALSWAAGDEMDEVLRVLLKDGSGDPNLPDLVEDPNPPARSARPEKNPRDKQGRSPLLWAAGNGCTATVRTLLRDPRVVKGSVDKTGRNAFSWACEGGHAATVEMLINKRCPGVDEPDESGWAPLAWAIQTNTPEIVEMLVKAGADVNRVDLTKRSVLSWAENFRHARVIQAVRQAMENASARS
ncbi:hypothetical protein B0H66DRAFT_506297 [Apodospora peruviana]|uniref:Nephrocystin 3-like N-terminal domain-containing protein n=1 Tax=Apodospora peruviana TaxID=516989 RepID=A0AAE0HSB4_9PEZI|nr:hypothetical protein B0H66DRAFT_506297 [Apodospora peruviana]